MRLIICLFIAFIGLSLVSSAESVDARITKLEEEVKKLQEVNTAIMKKLEQSPASPMIRRRVIPLPSKTQDPINIVEPTERVVEFNGHSYKFIPKKMPWKNAKKMAEDMGGYLVCITSQEEQEVISNLITINSQIQPTWIGLTDEGKEGEFKWINGEKLNYKNWSSGNPNNDDDKGAKQNYAWLGFFGSSNWDDNWEYALNYSVVEFDKPLPLPQQSTEKVKEVELKEAEFEFEKHSYKFIPKKESWLRAKKSAEKMGGYLVVINSEDEEKYLEKKTQEILGVVDQGVWIGLNDIDEEGKWSWVNGDKLTYTKWHKGEPNNNCGHPESCVLLNKRADYGWNDGAMDSEHYYIVEKDK